MTRMTTKTVFSLTLTVAAFSLAGCSSEYHDNRDPYMELSTPGMVRAVPPMVNTPDTTAVENSNVDLGIEPRANMSPVLTPVQRPTVIESPPETGPDVQMLGQPGTGPALMNPSAENMPGMP